VRSDRLSAFARSEGRAGVLLDFDGTLSPIVARPELAKIRDGARRSLARLASRYPLVAVISGRTDAELAALVDVPGVRLVGMYGMGDPGAVPEGMAEAVGLAAAGVAGARVEAKGSSIAVHVRGAADPDAAGEALQDPLAEIGRAHGFEVIAGKRVLELVREGRPMKEGAVERLVVDERLDAALFAGDDLADLRAFAALDRLSERGVLTVKIAVRGPETPRVLTDAADIVVDGPAGLVILLDRL
jgi:trehalose 6-phosphate phosphatase